jgi:hypothetical protein
MKKDSDTYNWSEVRSVMIPLHVFDTAFRHPLPKELQMNQLTNECKKSSVIVTLAAAEQYCFFQCPVEDRVLEGVSLRGRFGDISVLETGEIVPIQEGRNDPGYRDAIKLEVAQATAAQYLGL